MFGTQYTGKKRVFLWEQAIAASQRKGMCQAILGYDNTPICSRIYTFAWVLDRVLWV